MAIIEVKVPQLSESVAEATLLQWKKKAGEAVAADEILIEVETDKVVLEVPAPAAGVITEVVVADGGTVVSDQLIAKIDTEASAGAVSASAATVAPAASAAVSAPAAAAAQGGSKGDVAMPAAAKLLADNNLSTAQVAGSGKTAALPRAMCLVRSARVRPSLLLRSLHRQCPRRCRRYRCRCRLPSASMIAPSSACP